MALKLYELVGADVESKFSPHCWKARLALSHKGVNFESVPVRFTEKETIAFSGQPLLPILQDGDNHVNDSWHIACYLEDELPDSPSLFGDEAGKALAESINQWCDTNLAPHVRPIILKTLYETIAEKDKAYFRESREAKIGMTIEAFSEKRDAAIKSLREELASVRQMLAEQPFIGGQQATYADICLLGTFMWMAAVDDVAFIEESDIVYEWFQRMLDLYPTAKENVLVAA